MADFLDNIDKAIKKLGDYAIEIGVFSNHSKRKVQVGVTNAELMFIHEHGSPLQNIPARPVLQMTLEYAYTELLPKMMNELIDCALDENTIELETALSKLAMRMESYARKLIYSNDGRLESNSPRTIARKHADHPLFDTGQLARSITCRVIKK